MCLRVSACNDDGMSANSAKRLCQAVSGWTEPFRSLVFGRCLSKVFFAHMLTSAMLFLGWGVVDLGGIRDAPALQIKLIY